MTDGPLDDLCRHYGIATRIEGRAVPEDSLRRILAGIGVDPAGPVAGEAAPVEISAPLGVACYLPDWLRADGAWGISCQLYELRSARSWGIGDFGDLAAMARIAARAGADFLGVNPLHALFLADPSRRSPFSPSNRRFLNPLCIAMDDLPGAEPPGRDSTDTGGDLVDYEAVTRAKIGALRGVFARRRFGRRFGRDAFEAFRQEGGAGLERHALFECLSAALVAEGHGAGWRDWPEEYRDVSGAAVAEFAKGYAEEVTFQVWLQWIASGQLAAARQAARDAGMRIGLYLDLAVGEASDGSATWSAPATVLRGLTIGAPPDVFAQDGQNWLLTGPSPLALTEQDFAPFRDLIAAQLRHGGALRIDHAMALWQLFVIPEGESAAAGAHLRYPFADLLRVLAQESHRHEAVIIGEDLGYVPPGFREAMEAVRLLSYRILYFETEYGLFRRSETYPETAMACISTHDLPVLERWWTGEDINYRERFGLIRPDSAGRHRENRASEREALVGAMVDAGLLPEGSGLAGAEALPREVLIAAHRFLARTPCLLAAVRLADLVGPGDPTNIPGTVDEYPNWQPRSPVPVEEIEAQERFAEVTAAMREERPRGGRGR